MLYVDNKFQFLLDKDASQVLEAIRSTGVVITPAYRNYAHVVCSSAKSLGVWDNMIALYGLVGGTLDAHKWNWKDLRDSNAGYRLTFPNGVSHSELGIVGNGTSQYGETHIPNTVINTTNFGITTQFNTVGNASAPQGDISIIHNGNNGAGVFELLSGGSYQQIAIGNNSTYDNLQVPLKTGIYSGQLNNDLLSLVNDGNIISKTSLISLIPPTSTFKILCRYVSLHNIYQYFSTKRYTFFAVHNSLNNIEKFQRDMRVAQGILNRV